MTTETPVVPTRELQLELQVMVEHKNALIAKGQALQAQATAIQAQGALLQIEGERTDAEISRLKTLLAPKPAAPPVAVDSGGCAPPVHVPAEEAAA